MRCPHCSTSIRLESRSYTYQIESDGFRIKDGCCPECKKMIVLLEQGIYQWIDGEGDLTDVTLSMTLYPKFTNITVDTAIPQKYRDDLNEAHAVLSISPKSSAALSRRMLQNILREEYHINKRNLYEEIKEFLELSNIPKRLKDETDVIRHVGNFAAHPEKYRTTGEIVEVETEEAEWLIEVLNDILDFTFVQPQREQDRKDKLNEKLRNMGKPTL